MDKFEERLVESLQRDGRTPPPVGLVADAVQQLAPREPRRSDTVLRLATGLAGLAVIAALLVLSLPPGRSGVGSLPSPTAAAVSVGIEATPPARTSGPEPPMPPASLATPPTPRTSVPASDSPPLSDDEFWANVSNFGVFGHTYESLRDITAASHLVVTGRLVGTQLGEVYPFGQDLPPGLDEPYQEIFGIVEIEEVLKGEAISQTPGQILVAGLGWPDMSASDLPDGRFILFVVNHAQMRQDRGRPASPDPQDRFHYERRNGYQCVLPETGGSIDVIDGPEGWEDAIGPFPSDLDGRAFAEIVAEIRRLAAVGTARVDA